MKIGDVIVVIGKTNHGRARIKGHGVHYKILGAIRRPDRINVESVSTGYKRWIQLNDDKHFGILRVSASKELLEGVKNNIRVYKALQININK